MSYSQKGYRDWILQRLTAILMAIYIVVFGILYAVNSPVDYYQWREFFSSGWVQVSTMIFVFSILWHAWVGMWTICTDYLNCAVMRTLVVSLIFVALLGEFFWVLHVLISI